MNSALGPVRRRLASLSLAGCAVALLLSSNCSNSSSKKNATALKLQIEAIENGAGEEFEPDEEITVACDGHLTVHFGPDEDIPHLLDHWDLRPPGDCEDHANCGYIQMELLSVAGKTARVSRATLSIVLAPSLVTTELVRLRARLIDGRDGTPYLNAGKPVEDSAELKLQFADCPAPADGGAGGMGGAQGGSTSSAGAPALGGGGSAG
jgi:hypothetical protein